MRNTVKKIRILIPAGIKNIILDLGGVLLDIDYSLTQKAFGRYCGNKFALLYSEKWQAAFFSDFEGGEITPGKFREILLKKTGVNISTRRFDHAWNSMLLRFPPNRIRLLKSLKKQYRLFLLSNTNVIHHKWFIKKYKHVKDFFDRMYFSHQVHMRKPEKRIFRLVLTENKLQANETFFLDDSPQHVEGAQKCGIRARRVNCLEEIFK